MTDTSAPIEKRIFVVINPMAGSCDAGDVRRILTHYFTRTDWSFEFYETTGEEHVGDVVNDALDKGFNLIVAAGGDGTVSQVAGALVHTGIPLAIIPVGTVNALAQELVIPLDTAQASALIVGTHRTTVIDAMEVNGQYFFFHIGIGLDSVVIRDTKKEDKRRFGPLAFLSKALMEVAEFRPQHFTIIADGRYSHPRALQVLIANGGVMGIPQLRWGPNIRIDDKRVDICIIQINSPLDYANLAWHFVRYHHKRSRNVQYMSARHYVAVDTIEPLPVHGDGEIIGQTPVQVRIVPGAIRVIVPIHRE